LYKLNYGIPLSSFFASSAQNDESATISPAVRHLLSLHKVESRSIKGTGRKGRLLKGDVLQYLANPSVSASSQIIKEEKKLDRNTSSLQKAVPSYEDIPNSNIRKIIAQRLAEAKRTIPHHYISSQIALDQLLDLRSSLNAKQDVKLSVNDFIVRACALALRDVPEVNASWVKGEVKYSTSVDLSVAVATEKGHLRQL